MAKRDLSSLTSAPANLHCGGPVLSIATAAPFGSYPKREFWRVTSMNTEMRKTGVDVVGDMPWGTHFCLFYETKADLLETSVSYCKAGLESQEFCLWVVAEPLAVEDARRALKRAVS